MHKQDILVLELHGIKEISVLLQILDRSMDALSEINTTQSRIEFLVLQQIKARIPMIAVKDKRDA